MIKYSRVLFSFVAFAVLLLGTIGFANAQSIEPSGAFFHSYTGPFSAVEWTHFRSRPGDDRYQFSDIRGLAPYEGTILESGEITWDTTGISSGTGTFSSQDNATMTLNYFGDEYQSTLRRAPATDSSFITQIESRVSGDTSFNGNWNLVIEDLDPVTGAVLGTQTTAANIEITNDLLLLTYDDGTFYQGVFEDSDHAGFRVVLPNEGLIDEFASFDGSATSLSVDLMGDVRFTSPDSFSATWLTQTRVSPGFQQQFVQRISGSRAVPEPAAGFAILLLGSLACLRRTRANGCEPFECG